MKITNTQLEIAADLDLVMKTLSPRARDVLRQITILHPVARTPALIAEIREVFIFRATMADIVKVSAVSRDASENIEIQKSEY